LNIEFRLLSGVVDLFRHFPGSMLRGYMLPRYMMLLALLCMINHQSSSSIEGELGTETDVVACRIFH